MSHMRYTTVEDNVVRNEGALLGIAHGFPMKLQTSSAHGILAQSVKSVKQQSNTMKPDPGFSLADAFHSLVQVNCWMLISHNLLGTVSLESLPALPS